MRTRAVFRANRTGLGEEELFALRAAAHPIQRILPFPDGKRLLVLTADTVSGLEIFHAYDVEITSRAANDLGELPGDVFQASWDEAGKSVLFGRTVKGLSNIWKFSLQDKALSQVTFGTGPDLWPMPAPAGKGLYILYGESAGVLTAYDPNTKQAIDISA